MLFYNFLGNDELKRRLSDPDFRQKLPHAIIIEGKKGTGKHSLAKAIALSANCEHNPPCLKCATCLKLLSDESPDCIRIGLTDGRATLGVDTVRLIRSDAYITPNDNLYKIYIIENADKLTIEAQNAFLKVLEEPPEYAVFILLCENSESLLVTVRSRAQIMKTEIFSSEILKKYLIENSETDMISDPEALELAVMLSGGSVGVALDYTKDENAAQAIKIYRQCSNMIGLIIRRAPAAEIFESLFSSGLSRDEAVDFFERLALSFRDGLAYKLTSESERLFFVNEQDVQALSGSCTVSFLIDAIELCSKYRLILEANVSVQTVFVSFASEIKKLRGR